MNKVLEEKWNQMQSAKHELMSLLEQWSELELSTKPAAVGWSALQVAEHLLVAETGTLGYIKKKSSSGWDVLETTGEEHLRNGKAVNDRLTSSERYKAPSILPEPIGNLPLEEINTKWNALRADWQMMLENVEENQLDKLVFKQPVAGMLNIMQTLDFINNHIRHHLPQLQRLKEEVQVR